MTEAVRPWWGGATLYQVYVRSFRDLDGDGSGDLRGVTASLDYLAWLGVDGVWLSPTMPSPDHDWGYDVADYRNVHPALGNLEDLDELVAEAGSRGLRVLLDLVPNHTSSEHAWFVEARSSRDADRRSYYVWADPGDGGGPPNNWLDHTGEPAWTFDDATGQYYLHNFLPSQPDLNWWDPRVHQEFREILEFWLDRGIAGFRIDVAHGLYKDASLRDDPPAPEGDPRGRFGLLPRHSANRPEVHGVYRTWRALAERRDPPALLLGETWVLDADELASYYGAGDELQLAFNFPFTFAPFEADALRTVVRDTLGRLPPGASAVWMASNHDLSRFPTRWCGGDPAKVRAALVLLATLPGTLVLYYGDELGMTDVEVPLRRQLDDMTRGGRGRDGFVRDRARTPMPWTAARGAGFTPAGVEPWLPIGEHAEVNVEAGRRDPGSTLSLARQLLSLRRAYLRDATYEELDGEDAPWRFRSGALLVVANLDDRPADVGEATGTVLCSSRPARRVGLPAGQSRVEPWEVLVLGDGRVGEDHAAR